MREIFDSLRDFIIIDAEVLRRQARYIPALGILDADIKDYELDVGGDDEVVRITAGVGALLWQPTDRANQEMQSTDKHV